MEKKVWWGFGVALALLGVVGLTVYSEVVKLRKNDTWVDHTHQVISSLRKVQSLVTDAETGQRGYVITGNKLFLGPYTGAVRELDGELSTLRKLIADNPEQQEGRRELEASTAKRMEQLRQVQILRESKGISAAGQEILTLEGMRTDSAIRQVVKLMEDREDRLLVGREQTALRTSQHSRSIIVLVGRAGSLGVRLWVGRRVVHGGGWCLRA
jgi:CHASE3 domain sensor protein